MQFLRIWRWSLSLPITHYFLWLNHFVVVIMEMPNDVANGNSGGKAGWSGAKTPWWPRQNYLEMLSASSTFDSRSSCRTPSTSLSGSTAYLPEEETMLPEDADASIVVALPDKDPPTEAGTCVGATRLDNLFGSGEDPPGIYNNYEYDSNINAAIEDVDDINDLVDGHIEILVDKESNILDEEEEEYLMADEVIAVEDKAQAEIKSTFNSVPSVSVAIAGTMADGEKKKVFNFMIE
jgi:hypothetical protein